MEKISNGGSAGRRLPRSAAETHAGAAMSTHTTSRTAAARLAEPGFWRLSADGREEVFARLRQQDAPAWIAEPADAGRAAGYHALVRHCDVVAASRNPRVFRSAPGVTTPEPARWVRLLFGDSMVNLDDPRHARLRGTVGRAFTPRVLAGIERDTHRIVRRVVDGMAAAGEGDFLATAATQVPFGVICDMMGIPAERRPAVLDRLNRTTQGSGMRRDLRSRVRVPGRGLWAMARMNRLVAQVGRRRRREPTGDLISALVTADVDGRALTSRELGAFFSLLLVAGVETTRNALAHGLWLLSAHPEQGELVRADPDRYLPGAVEEIVRYCSPIIQFRRTLAVDHEMGGRVLPAGSKVVMFYPSANRDEAVFDRPEVFDITRDPNPHVGYGGGGPHICLGANLARQEMTLLFRELLTRLPGIRAAGPPRLVPSSFDHRVGSLRYVVR